MKRKLAFIGAGKSPVIPVQDMPKLKLSVTGLRAGDWVVAICDGEPWGQFESCGLFELPRSDVVQVQVMGARTAVCHLIG